MPQYRKPYVTALDRAFGWGFEAAISAPVGLAHGLVEGVAGREIGRHGLNRSNVLQSLSYEGTRRLGGAVGGVTRMAGQAIGTIAPYVAKDLWRGGVAAAKGVYRGARNLANAATVRSTQNLGNFFTGREWNPSFWRGTYAYAGAIGGLMGFAQRDISAGLHPYAEPNALPSLTTGGAIPRSQGLSSTGDLALALHSNRHG